MATMRDGGWDGPPLPEGWVWTTIGKVTQPIEKVQPRETPEWQFTYLDISSIDNQAYRITEPKTYYGTDAPSRARQSVKAGDVLFSTVRTYLKNVALVPEIHDGQIASTGFSVLRATSVTLPKYLFYYSLTDGFLNALSKLQRGTSYPAVRDGDVRAQPVPIAPLPEQRRIVAEIETQFTRLDAAVAALERVQTALGRYRASVLKAACEGRLVPTEAELAHAERRARWEAEQWAKEVERAKKKAAQARRKAAGRPARIRDLADEEWLDLAEAEFGKYLPKGDRGKRKYKEPKPPDMEDLADLPEGWVWATMEQCFKVERGRFLVRPRNDPRYYGGNYPFIQIGDLPRDGGNITSFSQTLNSDGLQISRMFPRGTVLIAIVGATIANTGILTFDSCCPDSLVTFQALDEVRLRYAELYLRSKKLEIRKSSYASGGQPNINLRVLNPYPILLPPLAEQRRIVEEVERRLSVVEALEAAVATNLRRAERLRQAVLKRAFEGRLVPQDPSDEPASALLARVKAEREGRAGGKGKHQAGQMRLPLS